MFLGLVWFCQWACYGITLSECHQIETSLAPPRHAVENKLQELFKDDTVLKELFPVLKPSCVKSALEQFLPRCLLEGMETVTDSLRMETAVQLSLCQFEASGLEDIPFECSYTRSTEDMMTCMMKLETSNQWWTTYNGYYQNLPVLCISQDPIFQKEQIVQTFMNITKMVKELNNNWESSFNDYMTNVDKNISQNINKLDTRFNDTIRKIDNWNINITSLFEDTYQGLFQNKTTFDNIFKEKDDAILKQIATLQEIIEDVSNKLTEDNLVAKLEEQNIRALTIYNEVGTELKDLKRERDYEQEELIIYMRNLKDNIEYMNNEIDLMSKIKINNIEENIQTQLEMINKEFVSEWLSLTQILNKDIQIWNEIIEDNFNMITKKLETTIEKVDYLENKVNVLFKIFCNVIASFQFGFKIITNFLWSSKKMALIFIIFPLIKLLKRQVLQLKINKILYWIVIFSGILVGNRLGLQIVTKRYFTNVVI